MTLTLVLSFQATNHGGALTSCSISPLLPLGLTLNSANCDISATDTLSTTSSATQYTVTGSNVGNPSIQTTITIEIVAQPPTSLTYTPDIFTLVQGDAYTHNELPQPVVGGGRASSWSIDPDISGIGMEINAEGNLVTTSGAVVSATLPYNETYTVTATNSGGSISTNITVVVKAQAPAGLAYDGSNSQTYALHYNQAFGPKTPTLATGSGSGDTYSISSPLPTGLTFSETTGEIGGTPKALLWPPQQFKVTVSNTDGTDTAYLTISVIDSAPLDLAYPTTGFTYPKYENGVYQYTLGVSNGVLSPTHIGYTPSD